MNKIKIYDVVISDEQDGIYAFSLVSEPAIGIDFVKLSSEKQDVHLSFDDQKQVLRGPLVIPGIPIYRNGSGKRSPYYMRFSVDSALEMLRRATKTGALRNINIQHDGQFIDIANVYETWVIESKQDKAYDTYSHDDLPIGTVMMSAHVSNKNDWDKLKSSNIKGFSIEALLSFVESGEEIEMSLENDMLSIQSIILSDLSDDEKLDMIKKLPFMSK